MLFSFLRKNAPAAIGSGPLSSTASSASVVPAVVPALVPAVVTAPVAAHVPALAPAHVTASVTAAVTAPKLTAESTAVVTAGVAADVAADVAASLASAISSSRIVAKWAEPKAFPEPEWPSCTVQLWWADDMPRRYPSAKQIAEELFAAMQKQPGCAGKWVLAVSIERIICPRVCSELGWPLRPWMGKDGVAAHLADLSPFPPTCFRIE